MTGGKARPPAGAGEPGGVPGPYTARVGPEAVEAAARELYARQQVSGDPRSWDARRRDWDRHALTEGALALARIDARAVLREAGIDIEGLPRPGGDEEETT